MNVRGKRRIVASGLLSRIFRSIRRQLNIKVQALEVRFSSNCPSVVRQSFLTTPVNRTSPSRRIILYSFEYKARRNGVFVEL